MMHIAYSPSFHKIYKFPYFREIDAFCLICVFCFPLLFDHDAFMHHTLHVLDAPAVVMDVFCILTEDVTSIVVIIMLHGM